MKGGCHCGSVQYEVTGEAITHALCHCSDCRRNAGAPMVGWAMFLDENVKILKGATKTYESSQHGRREFCASCGSGLFYKNANVLPGIIDVQTGTLDSPNELPAKCQIQTAERLTWMTQIHNLPEFERFPSVN